MDVEESLDIRNRAFITCSTIVMGYKGSNILLMNGRLKIFISTHLVEKMASQ